MLAAPSLEPDLSAMRGADSEDEVGYSYYDKPTANRANSLDPSLSAGGSEFFPSDSSAATLRSPSTTTAVSSSATHHPGRVGEGLDEVHRATNELCMPSSQTYDESTEAEVDETGAEDNVQSRRGTDEEERQEWADDMLEPLQRLGEGAGGAVGKVRD
ncbi:hypothetical protein FS749_008655 [Ceratobasidium sp. UAMH 11750]|nr:hypothetical protein FS749_008655 [Ceratobasidium sp. UAMH 11750]